ncbi:Protein LOT5 [Escovopsis weberi]|uniref:Protein LOT5 n=1 Tax=Escovopsis weberi TaxID=150374 RepID=A0A0M9VS37_ESCWE|nr:Protein LOT5 [Escovopsis weberi]
MSDYVSLGTYQSTTPASFTDGRPVMHLSAAGVHAFIPQSQCDRLQIFEPRADSAALFGWSKEEEEEQGHGGATAHESLDVFITSKSFILFNMRLTAGVHIPYNLISIHGLKKVGDKQSVWIQLDIGHVDDDDDYEPVELTLMEPEPQAQPSDNPETPTAARLFQAIADCSDLNPDPSPADAPDPDGADDRILIERSAEHEALEGFRGVLRGAADGGLPPPLPGSGGWITADNLHEYFDKDGRWKGDGENGAAIEVEMEGEGAGAGDEDEEETGEAEGADDAAGEGAGEPLGEGAGRTRDRDELRKNGLDGDEEGDDPENKRPRVA